VLQLLVLMLLLLLLLSYQCCHGVVACTTARNSADTPADLLCDGMQERTNKVMATARMVIVTALCSTGQTRSSENFVPSTLHRHYTHDEQLFRC
jgi:hypothetical protein